ncbi:MAG: DNA cytosine methyltransferase [Chthoniobacter sp.]|nr:DNA cytosine methyltransferase [Chthoniobacter sp.]
MSAPTFLDLFCGCGGFSLGMERAGFQCLAAIDFNAEAIKTLRANFPHLGEERARQEDLTTFRPEHLEKIIGTDRVDVIVGGPPCQGFSTARQVDGANHGERLKADPRRQLFRELLRYVEFFQPRVFIMENVLGLRTAAGGEYFTAVQHEARRVGHGRGLPGYRVHGQIEDAYSLGVPQKRQRQLIIGVRGDLPGYFPPDLHPAKRALPGTNLGAAISDLPPIPAGGGEEVCAYDRWWRRNALARFGPAARNYLFKVLEVLKARQLTAHRARPHSDRDLRDFARLAEGQSSAQAMRAGIEFEFPYKKTTFTDRYTRQSRHASCSTIVAHLSKDGLMFIHPQQNRSLTPREAARIQSFPDWFQFPVARTHQFRLIGNAVPPLVSEAVGDAVRGFLRVSSSLSPRLRQMALPLARQRPTHEKKRGRPPLDLPQDILQALARVRVLAQANPTQIRAFDNAAFRRGWHALLFAFPELHPDNAFPKAHGSARFDAEPPLAEAHEWRERFERSGWPVALVPIGAEAWRRYEVGELSERSFYCVGAQRAGLNLRRNSGQHSSSI